ncbi:hypothetical protein [Capillimicrobium parvum]|uniref:hypothetical protein n=1 Tax=Capillimicrobium parvum TaxID=2884022 RepID=UPI00216B128F|nr:hypothetical protein [Capillimicrobium parvum]
MAEVAEQMTVLRHKAEQVEELVSPPRSVRERRPETAAEESLAQRRWGWYQGLEDAVLDLSNSLPEGTEDYDARKLFEFLIELRRAITADPEASDERGEVELATIKMRDVVHRIGRRLEHNILDDPQSAARSVFTTLRSVGVGDLSRLLGVSTKTINTWKAGGPVTRKADRVVVLAQLLTYLRSSMTPTGLVMWFDAPRHQLGGRTPLQLLDENEAAARETLVALARGARGQLAG